jgi:two-component system sensor histidine kinase KdpD
MPQESLRPSPEALLAEARKEGRGRLKIFLGAAPGVGKTYAMLEAAQLRKREGVDVAIGLLETHGRRDTEALMAGLEVLPRTQIDYRGRKFPELDVDGILRRRPQLVLVDEYAHSNVPGTRHLKRHEDIAELLAAGINVYSTLNIQHLESLNDIVERISGVRVRETIPDQALDAADEIELVDLPTEDLLQRLKEGKVYIPETARQAMAQFFSRGNLTALRELAMRTAAERVDAQVLDYMKTHAVTGPWPTRERIMVCVSEAGIGQRVIRAARNMAETRRIPWIAVHVETDRTRRLPEDSKDRIARNLQLAERLGGEAVTISGTNLVGDLLAYAASRNITHIVVGRPLALGLPSLLRPSVADQLIRRGEKFEITVVNWTEEEAEESGAAERPQPAFPNPRDLLTAALVAVIAAAASFVLERWLPAPWLSLVFLTGVLVVAVRIGLWPSLLTALLSFGLLNFFFTEPIHTFSIGSNTDLAALVFFLLVAMLAGNEGARMRSHVLALRESARRMSELYEFNRKLATAVGINEATAAVAQHIFGVSGSEVVVMLPDAYGKLLVKPGSTEKRPLGDIDRAAAVWAFEHRSPSGWATDTLPAAAWMFLPLGTPRGALGVLGIRRVKEQQTLPAGQMRVFNTIADQAALAIERIHLAGDIEQARLLTETEQLRSALLSSVSHDLRTPLVSIMGSASTLSQMGDKLDAAQKQALLETLLAEAERLNRFVQNLLDMTRLGYGALKAKPDWCDLRDIVGEARQRLKNVLAGHELLLDIRVPLVYADPVLMEQVLVNLLDNAAKYSPAGATIRIEARLEENEVVMGIVDEGPGIPAEDREKVFDMFYRVKAGDSQTAGTGLGLSICRGLLEAQGGSIKIAAGNNGRGTRVELRMPHRERAAASVASRGAER